MKKFKFLSVCFVVCALAAAFAIVPGAFAEDASADAPVAVTLNGAPAEDLSFSKDEKVTLDAQTDLEGRIRWQYLADEAENLWVSVYGENSASFTLTYAKVFNMLNDENTAQIRCAVGEVFSDPVTVTLKEQSAPIAKAMSASPFALTRAAEEEGTDEGTGEGTEEGDVTEDTSEDPPYTFTINYIDESNQAAADPFVAKDIQADMAVHISVSSPYVEGMVPDNAVSEYVYQMIGSEKEQVVYKSGTPTPEGSETDNYSFIVKYLKFGTNEPVANPYEGNYSLNHLYDQVVQSPEVTGYLPYVQTVGRDYNSEGAEYLPGYPDGWVLAKNIRLIYNSNVSRRIELTVYYMPDDVNYKVSYFKQNLNNSEYTKADEVTLTGKTESSIDTAKINEVTYEGFTRLLYDSSAKIAADGSTEVEVYFDRNYYLMMFDLDGGYGVEPTYAPYETPLTYAEPAKDGYAFVGWDNLATTDTVENIATRDLPATMPVGGGSYRAVWTAASSYFTVAYWLEDPDVTDKYNYWGSYQIGITEAGTKDGTVTTGSTVNGVTYKDYPDTVAQKYGFKADEMDYSAYHHADSNVEVKGDGSSVVNVYYNRKAYTLKFYYAMSTGSGANIKYYVVGGSTYYFAKLSDESDRDSEIKLLDGYISSHMDICGEVSEPSLNTEGLKRNYTIGSDVSTVNGYKYHYISFNAKYGADITDLWPCNVFNSVQRKYNNNHGNWSGTTAFVSAWNGEYNVYYSLHHSGKDGTPEGNQTIKGNYCELDYQLLWEKGDPEDMTVSYLCFWENGANVNWSIPELYRYNTYVPILEGQSTDGLTTKVVNGVTYYRSHTYDTCDNSTVPEQTAPGLIGFTPIPVTDNDFEKIEWSEDQIEAAGFDGVYSEAYDVNFYYTRNIYKLTFYNMGDEVRTENVLYEAKNPAFDAYVPPYPSDLEAGAYEFEGWYTSETFKPGTKVNFTNSTMPAHNVMVYARWVPKTYTVQFYLDEDAMKADTKLEGYPDLKVSHGQKVKDPVPDPENGDYNFVAWFYQDENGVEKAFDFDMMPVRQNMKVYGKWKADAIKPYWVYYRAAGTDIADPELYVADMTTGSGLVGTLKTFEAKGADELYEAYREGWFPTEQSHSFTLSLDGENTYVFDYVEVAAVPYIVKYINKETGEPMTQVPEKTVSNNRKAAVTENFVAIPGYVPDAYQKRLILTADAAQTGNNVITFYYTADTTHAYYKIGHYTENLKASESDETTWDEYASTQTMGDINTTYPTDGKTDGSTLKLDIPGFTFDPNVAGSVLSGTLTSAGLELKLYYTRNEYPYEIRHQNRATGANLKAPQTGTMKYQATLTASSETFFGYTLDTLVSDPTQSKIIQIENGSAASKNVITFYYTENQAMYTYSVVGPDGCGTVSKNSETVNVLSGNAKGSTATANEGYRFVGWYSDSACTDLVSTVASYIPQKTTDDDDHTYYTGGQYYAKFIYDTADLRITKSGVDETLDPNTEFLFHVQGDPTDAHTRDIDITVTVTGNGLVVVNDLPVGKYTVTEITDWSWRYTPDQEVKNVTVVSEASIIANIVTFANSRNADNKWLDYNVSADNLFKPNSTPEIGNE